MKFLSRGNKPKKSSQLIANAGSTPQAIVRDVSKSPIERLSGWTKSMLLRKAVWIPTVVVLLVCSVAALYYVTKEKPEVVVPPNEVVDMKTLNVEAEKKIIAAKLEDTSQALTSTATAEDKKIFYTNKLWLMVKDGKQTEIGKFYVDEVKPQGVEFDVDINETLVRSLMMSEYKEEARPILAKVIAFYKESSATADATTMKYLEDKLAYYEELEASW